MAKELVVSSNRHETKLAILEDDRLVEIYVERRSRQAVAGSIFKGRVSRVLPGMQSAFVKVGLPRDAFLYVSDVLDRTAPLEDGDEPDPADGAVEEAPERNGRAASGRRRSRRGGRSKRREARRPEAEAESADDAPRAEAAAETAAPDAEAADGAAAGDAPAEEAESPAGGRSGRRRRLRDWFRRAEADPADDDAGGDDAGASGDPPPETAAEAETGFEVLPGESLSKYSADREDPAANGAAGVGADEDEALADAGQDGASGGAGEAEEEASASGGEAEGRALDEADEADDDIEYDDEVEDASGGPPAAAADGSARQAEDARLDAAMESAAEQAEEAEEADVDGPPDADEDAGDAPAAAAAVASSPESSRFERRSRRGRRRRSRGGRPAEASGEEQDAENGAESPADEDETSLPDGAAAPNIKDLLEPGQELIVQIAKEPLGKKGARITSHVALPGRFMVYMPTVNHNGVSKKIRSDAERARLRRIVKACAEGKPGGFIVRTAGRGASEEDLQADLEFLYKQWQGILDKAEKRRAPAVLYHDLDIVERVMRDRLGQSYKTIWVDGEEEYERILRFVERFQPDLLDRVKFYSRPMPIYDQFNISQDLEKALKPKVWLKSGGYLVISQTEALVAIDVNTGKYVGKSDRLEDTIVKTNMEAAEEVVRQMRLRDLGGIVIVDFIDMEDAKNRNDVYRTLENALRRDRAPAKALPFNDFGLVAITRKRVKQSLERALCAPCPTCSGSGIVKSAPTVISEILNESRKLALEDNEDKEGKDVVLRVYPEVAKALKSRSNLYLRELEETFQANVLVRADAQMNPEQFDFH